MSSSSSKKDIQLFFKNKLTERVKNPSLYKEYSNNFTLDLINYDLYNEDINNLINLIIATEKLTSLKLRLSNTLTEKDSLKKLLRKISLKKQFTSLSFFIKYLNEDLLNCFLEFLTKINQSVTELEIRIKYDKIKKEEITTKSIIDNLIKNNNNGIQTLKFNRCRFITKENLDSLNCLIKKNKNILKNLSIELKRINEDIFTPDISSLEKVQIIYCNLASIKYIPLEKLDLSNNNIGIMGIEDITEHLKKESCSLKKLNLSYNFLGNNGITKLSECFKSNKSLISLKVEENHIFNDGLINFAKNIGYKYNKTLSKINFKNNSITNEGIIEFCSILKDEPENRFTKIDFRMNPIDKNGLSELDFFLSKFNNIYKLFYMNFYANVSFENLFFYTKSLNKIKQLIFLSYYLPEQCIKDFNDLLLNNKNIEKIVFSIYRDNNEILIKNIYTGIKNNIKLTHLFLPMCCMKDEGAELLSKALFNNISIQEINLEDNKIGLRGIKELSEKVFGKISINKINLAHNLMDEECAFYLGQSLKNALNIKYLYLNSNKLMDNGCKHISEGLSDNKTLIELNLDYNKITNIGINYLSKTLIKIESFMKLSLSTNLITEISDEFYSLFSWVEMIIISDNPINIKEIPKLIKTISNNRLFKKLRFKINDSDYNETNFIENYYLKKIDISFNTKYNNSLIKNILYLKNLSILNLQHNNIQDKDIQILVQYCFEFQTPLKELLVQNNLISLEGSKAIAELLKNNNYLKKLNISSNSIFSSGINIICDSIINYKNILIELFINYIDCNDSCTTKIIDMLKKNKNLCELSIIGNKFTNKGTDQILSSLRYNSTLKKLSLGSKYINSEAFYNLSNYLSFNKTLLILEIKSSKFGDKMLKKLSKIFLYNNTLVNIFLVDNLLTYESIVHFGQFTIKNKTINTIKVMFNAQRSEEPNIRSSNPHLIFS